ncbi:hypothetical protein P154DRAFT_573287 [Amniculicola lignicola CBS 123094]|uniref:Uncharacterized protein n=1 Tax=Amniculicola lignicola CBS 123094 TaxID=1392246 RepID=A0A6A5WN50_9PLEO|nr:hypothetical protein P154DRAFT_573287 [Amniculicola lignicola CBS 123094]
MSTSFGDEGMEQDPTALLDSILEAADKPPYDDYFEMQDPPVVDRTSNAAIEYTRLNLILGDEADPFPQGDPFSVVPARADTKAEKAKKREASEPSTPPIGGKKWKEMLLNSIQMLHETAAINIAFDEYDPKTAVPLKLANYYENLPRSPPTKISSCLATIGPNMHDKISTFEHACLVHHASEAERGRTIMFTDGSYRFDVNVGAAAVVWRDGHPGGWGRWETHCVAGRNHGSMETEEIGLLEGLWMIRRKQIRDENTLLQVDLYTDALHVLEKLMKCEKKGVWPVVYQKVLHAANLITAGGTTLTIRRVPGHASVPGNVLADRIAGLTTRYLEAKKIKKEIGKRTSRINGP